MIRNSVNKKMSKLYFKKLLWREPEQIFSALFAGQKHAFWLEDNLETRDKQQEIRRKRQFSYMGIAEKTIKYTISNNILSITNDSKLASEPVRTEKLQMDIFVYLKEELGKQEKTNKNSFSEVPGDFTGGWVGYFGYELNHEDVRGVGRLTKQRMPDAAFLGADRFLAFDGKDKDVYLVCVSPTATMATQWFDETIKQISKMSGLPKTAKSIKSGSKQKQLIFSLARNRTQYLEDIKNCKEYLACGDAYQICLTNQFSINLKTDWTELFLELRRANPAPFSAYLNFGDFALISSSPELFLRTDVNGIVKSKPMKGTAERGKTVEEDKVLSNKLGKTDKDFAENVMIVDLVRNDLGKVCDTGSIEVVKPLSVETYKTVHQLVSTVRGKLKNGKTIIDAIQAAFPGGSMTGAPKIRAMEIIAELEKQPRGIYSGCFGYIGRNGAASLAMTIRTIVAGENKLSFGSGGAILTDSNPEAEYKEMLLKAKALIEAIVKTAGAKNYKIINK